MPPVGHSQIEAHEILRSNELDVRLSLTLALSTIQVSVRFSLVKFPKIIVNACERYCHSIVPKPYCRSHRLRCLRGNMSTKLKVAAGLDRFSETDMILENRGHACHDYPPCKGSFENQFGSCTLGKIKSRQ
ncbi:hypothetical protein TNCV_3087091 [Trichonephila clavipes]|nr:hypothetical protein TNCV_3087091 [Trichonephila clavipes]